MKKSEYSEMSKYESTYWWHTGRLKIVDRQLKLIAGNRKSLKILNVGCGTGGTIKTIEKYGEVSNVDVSEEALKFLRLKGYSGTLIHGTPLPFDSDSFDIVIALDVLEHIKDDEESLKEWYRVLKNDGKVLITVPAYQWLWSGHDEALHHQRRYTVPSLIHDLNRSNLRPKFVSYAISFSFPLVVGFRALHYLTGRKATNKTSYVPVSPFINDFFANILGVEARILEKIKLPFGTTVLGVFEK